MVYHSLVMVDQTMYTVKQLAKLAGVSVRTLHYYDEIGLLPPALVEDNGYRRYDQDSVLTLQQILFYRELGLNLKDIAEIIHRPDFDVLQALQEHKTELRRQTKRLERLIETVDKTIQHLQGVYAMSKNELFSGFSEEQQKKYFEEAEQLYDLKLVRQSQRRWESYTQQQKDDIRAQGEAIHLAILEHMEEGPAGHDVQSQVAALHRHFVNSYYDCTYEIFRGLGQMWVDDPRFNAVYEEIKPGFSELLRDAVYIYTQGKSGLPEV